MTTRDQYMQVARQIADYLNSFRLAFKTYQISDFDGMIKSVAGDSARVSGGGDTSEQLRIALLERGFTIFPAIENSEDGYVRVIRTNSLVGSLLNAFVYVGPNGDTELASLLNTVKNRNRPDDLGQDNEDGRV